MAALFNACPSDVQSADLDCDARTSGELKDAVSLVETESNQAAQVRIVHPGRHTARWVAATILLASSIHLCSVALRAWQQRQACAQLPPADTSSNPEIPLVEQCPQCAPGRDSNAQTTSDTTRTNQEFSGAPHNLPALNAVAIQRSVPPPAQDRMLDLHQAMHSVVWNGAGSLPQVKPIAWPIPDSVLFLYEATPNGITPQRQSATGFILNVPDHIGRVSMYLVTARHVVDPEWASCGRKNPSKLTVRLNRWGGGIGYESIALELRHTRLFITPSDDLIDLALIPIGTESVPNLARYKLSGVEFDSLPTANELKALRAEQRIVTVGVAEPSLARLIDSPISEPGVIATAVAGKPVEVRCTTGSPGKEFAMWLIDTSVEHGVSGAPVYAALARGPARTPTPVLIGIQAVAWPDKGQAGISPIESLRDLVQLARSRNELAMDFHPRHLE